MKNADYSVMAMQDIEKAKLHVALELETDQLVMTVGSPEVEEDIGLENVIFCVLAHRHLSIWASTRENLSSGVCEQHMCRPACASAQSDQRLCY